MNIFPSISVDRTVSLNYHGNIHKSNKTISPWNQIPRIWPNRKAQNASTKCNGRPPGTHRSTDERQIPHFSLTFAKGPSAYLHCARRPGPDRCSNTARLLYERRLTVHFDADSSRLPLSRLDEGLSFRRWMKSNWNVSRRVGGRVPFKACKKSRVFRIRERLTFEGNRNELMQVCFFMMKLYSEMLKSKFCWNMI